MTPQHQTIFGDGENGSQRGNCFAAAIACLLDTPVSDVPNFCIADDWRGATNVWLKDYGLFYLDISIPEDARAEHLLEFAGHHVISGQGPRGRRHSVVGLAGKMVHDPHPSGAGLLTEEEYGFLIPVRPELVLSAGELMRELSEIEMAINQCSPPNFKGDGDVVTLAEKARWVADRCRGVSLDVSRERLRVEMMVPNARVAYLPLHAGGNLNHPDVEHGSVSSRNDKYIFVKFDRDVKAVGWQQAVAKACDPIDLALL